MVRKLNLTFVGIIRMMSEIKQAKAMYRGVEIESDIHPNYRYKIADILIDVALQNTERPGLFVFGEISRYLNESYGLGWSVLINKYGEIAYDAVGVRGTFMRTTVGPFSIIITKKAGTTEGDPLFFGAINAHICMSSEATGASELEKTVALSIVSELLIGTVTSVARISKFMSGAMEKAVGGKWTVIIGNSPYECATQPSIHIIHVDTLTFYVLFIATP